MRYLFEDFTLDTDQRELRSGRAIVALGPVAFRLLTLLLENRSRVVATAEIHQVVWAGRDLSASTIPTAISDLRRKLGDDPRSPRFIRSQYGAGYRFVAEVRERSGWQVNLRPGLLSVVESDERADLVGRRRELVSIDGALAGGCVLLAGPPGAGKSRLIERFVAANLSSERPILYARCDEVEERGPLAAMAALLAGMRSTPGMLATGVSQRTRATIERLVVGIELDSIGTGPTESGAGARHRLAEAVLEAFAHAERRGALLVVDDLHRIDASSMMLLARVLRECPTLGALLAYRDAEVSTSVAKEIETIDESGRTARVEVAGLGTPDAVDLVERRVGIRMPEDTAGRVIDLTGGNPFYLTKIADLLRESPDQLAASRLSLPSGMREAILKHLEGLSAASTWVLRCAAVLGREFDVGVLSEVSGLENPELSDCLAEARGRRILDGGDPARFAHVLVRDALYESAPNEAIHAKALRVTIEKCGVGPGAHSPDVARHALSAGSHLLWHERMAACASAGEWACGRFAFSEGADRFNDALEILRASGERDEGSEGELLRLLADAQHRSDKRDLAQENARESFELARTRGDAPGMARAALVYSPGFFAIEVGVVDEFLVAALEEARGRLSEDVDRGLRAEVGARLAMALYWAGDREARARLADEAVSEAQTAGGSVVAYALTAREVALWGPAFASDKEKVARIALEAARASEDHEMELVYLVYRISCLLQMGLMSEAEKEIEAFGEKARQVGHSNALWFVDLFEAMRRRMRGDYEGAAQYSERFVEKGREVGDRNADHCRVVHSVYHRMEYGPISDAVVIAEEQWRNYERVGAYRCSLPFLLWESGDEYGARVSFEEVAQGGFSKIPQNVEWLVGMAMLSEACVALGDKRRAVELYRLLLPHATECAVVGFGVAVFRPVGYFLGRLATLLGRFREAERHFSVALALADSCQSAPWQAYGQYGLAEMLLRRGRPADLKRATTILGSCADSAATLGLSTLEAAARRLRSLDLSDA